MNKKLNDKKYYHWLIYIIPSSSTNALAFTILAAPHHSFLNKNIFLKKKKKKKLNIYLPILQHQNSRMHSIIELHIISITKWKGELSQYEELEKLNKNKIGEKRGGGDGFDR